MDTRDEGPVADEVARAGALLARLGVAGARAAIDAWALAMRPGSVEGFLDALLDPEPQETPEGFNGRAYVEEVEDCVHALARRFPDELLRALESRRGLLARIGVFGPVSRLRDPRVTEWLDEALESRDGSRRWIALRELLARHDPDVIARLGSFLADRDATVAFNAAGGLRRWGRSADVPTLLAYSERAQIGERERAFDAIEAICAREGEPLPEAHPGARLTTIDVPEGAELRHGVTTALMVNHGDELARVDDEPLRAPVGAVVVGLDRDRNGRLEAIVLRYDPRARQAE